MYKPLLTRIALPEQEPEMNRGLLRTAIAGVAAVLIAGCGGESPTAGRAVSAAAAARVDQGMIEFARCMRAHGIAMADPFHRPGHAGLSLNLPEQGPATAAAYGSCEHFLQPLIEAKQAGAPRITSAVRLGLIHYAQCMRSHAIPMLDPTPQGALSLGEVPGISNGVGRSSPEFHSADHDCRHLLPASVHDDGTGP